MDDLLVRVDAQVSEFNAAFGSATKSTLTLEAALKKASAQQELYQRQIAKYGADSAQAQSALARAQMSNARLAEQQAAIQAKAAAEQRAALQAQATAYSRLGRTYATVGAGIALALGASAKAAVDWQDQFARVRQALEGTPQQLADVEQGLLGLSRELPATTEQLADMAQSAAQTGVATGDIVGFTKVVAELATTAPDLSDGATQLARFLNVTGTSTSQVENVASAMTKLGQAGASTVSEISDLGLRLAGAGRTANLSNGEILGFANAMTSLGLRVESAGTNFSSFLLSLNTAVTEGGKDLRTFAKVAGESSKEFARQYGQDSSAAITAFLDGLERIRTSGGNVAGVLESLGITGQRQVDVLNRLSQNTDLLNQSLETGTQAYKDNTALSETFGKQAETTASQIQIAQNNIHVLAISIGNELLPALGDAAHFLTDVASALGSLPGPVKDIAVVLGVATAAVTLFSGATLLLKARLIESQLALEASGASVTGYSKKALAARAGILALGIAIQQFGTDLAGSNDTVKSFVNIISTGLIAGAATANVAIGIGAGVATTFAEASKSAGNLDEAMARLRASMGGVTDTLQRQTGAVTDATTAWLQNTLATNGTYEAALQLGVSLNDVTLAAEGNAAAMKRVNDAIASSDAPQVIRDLFGPVVQSAIGGTTDAIDANAAALHAKYQAEADAQGVTKSSASIQGDFADSIYGSTDAIDEQVVALGTLNSEMARFLGKQIGVNQAILDSIKAQHEYKDGFDLTTQAGINNQQVLLNLQSALDKIDISTKTGARDFEAIAQRMVEFQIANGRSIPSAKEHAAALLGISDAAIQVKKNGKVVVDVSADTHDADRNLDNTRGKANDVDRLHPTVDVSADAASALSQINNVESALRLVDGMSANATVTITAILNTATSQQSAYNARHASGGPIYGPGTGTSDSIPARLSNGEFVMSAAAVRKVGLPELMRENSLGVSSDGYRFASGGSVGGGLLPVVRPGQGGNGGLLSLAELLRILARPDVPMTLKRVNELYRERQAEERALQPLLKAQRAAQDEVNRLAKDENATKKEQAQAARDLAKAEKAVTDQRDDLKDATDKWRQAQQELVSDMRASVEQTLSLSSAFGGEGTSLTAQGLLAKKRQGAADTKEFTRDLRIIRRKGADKDLIAELKAEGPTQDALTLLRDLIRQPRSYFKAEARADAADRSSARALATFGVAGAAGKGVTIGTQVQKQVNVHVHGVHTGPTIRQIKKSVRDAAEHGLLIAGAP